MQRLRKRKQATEEKVRAKKQCAASPYTVQAAALTLRVRKNRIRRAPRIKAVDLTAYDPVRRSSSVLPDGLQIQITSPFCSTHTPPLALVHPGAQTAHSWSASSTTIDIEATPSEPRALVRLIGFGLQLRDAGAVLAVLEQRGGLGIGGVGDGF
jgi:hypothetical protein